MIVLSIFDDAVHTLYTARTWLTNSLSLRKRAQAIFVVHYDAKLVAGTEHFAPMVDKLMLLPHVKGISELSLGVSPSSVPRMTMTVL